MKGSSILSKVDGKKIGDVEFLSFDGFSRVIDAHTESFIPGSILESLKNILITSEKELINLMSHEFGKPAWQCKDEIKRSVEFIMDYFETYSQENASPGSDTIFVLGSVAMPIFQFTKNLCENVGLYKKYIFKPSTKTAVTMQFISLELMQKIEPNFVAIVSISNETLDEILLKYSFSKIIKYFSGQLDIKISNLVDLSEKDTVMVIGEDSDIEMSSGIISQNIFSFEKFNQSRIQHIFVDEKISDEFCSKLSQKIELTLSSGDADVPGVNFTDTFKLYKRKGLNKFILEMVSMGADLISGSIQDKISSPILIKSTLALSDYYERDFWAPIIFIIPYKKVTQLPTLLKPFVKNKRLMAMIKSIDLDFIKKRLPIDLI